MPVKHIPTKEVHKGIKAGTTVCGYNTRENSTHWINTNEKITCMKNCCKS